MGTAYKDDRFVTNGGRVLMVIAEGPSIAAAREKVYAEVAKIDCENLFYRNDIAHCAFE
jgi:phosphoribosylamine--glycine ligase